MVCSALPPPSLSPSPTPSRLTPHLFYAREHGATAGQDNVVKQIRAHVSIALHNSIENGLVNAQGIFFADQGGIEQKLIMGFGATE